MTNEEKARQISSRLFDKDEQAGAFETLVITLTEMAEWKDQQFKEYLEEKIIFLESQRKSWNKSSNRYIAFSIAILNLQEIYAMRTF